MSVIPIGTPAAELAAELAEPWRLIAPEPGVHYNVPIEEYMAWDAVSASTLGLVARSPAHARAHIDRPVELKADDSTSTIVGTAVHAALLEPEHFSDRYVRGPGGNWSHKEPRDIKAALQARFPSALVLKPNKYDAVLEARDTLREHPSVRAIIQDWSGREVSIVWDDKETGVICKARPDIVLSGWKTIADLKTTIDASRAGFAREIAKWGYDCKAAFYLDGAKAVLGDFSYFLFVAAEAVEPYACGVYELEPVDIAAARDCNRRLLRIWAECAANNDWPAYPPEITYVSTPDWRRAQLETA